MAYEEHHRTGSHYMVHAGDTLEGVVRAYNKANSDKPQDPKQLAQSIAEVNNLPKLKDLQGNTRGYYLIAGQDLLVPAGHPLDPIQVNIASHLHFEVKQALANTSLQTDSSVHHRGHHQRSQSHQAMSL